MNVKEHDVYIDREPKVCDIATVIKVAGGIVWYDHSSLGPNQKMSIEHFNDYYKRIPLTNKTGKN